MLYTQSNECISVSKINLCLFPDNVGSAVREIIYFSPFNNFLQILVLHLSKKNKVCLSWHPCWSCTYNRSCCRKANQHYHLPAENPSHLSQRSVKCILQPKYNQSLLYTYSTKVHKQHGTLMWLHSTIADMPTCVWKDSQKQQFNAYDGSQHMSKSFSASAIRPLCVCVCVYVPRTPPGLLLLKRTSCF